MVGRPAPNAGDGVVGRPAPNGSGVSVRCRGLNHRPREQVLRAAQDGLHPMSVRVLRNCLGPPGSRNPFTNPFALEIERQLIEQVFVVPICRKVHPVPKQLAQAVIAQVVGNQH